LWGYARINRWSGTTSNREEAGRCRIAIVAASLDFVIGVDTHAKTHTLVVVTADGLVVDTGTFPTGNPGLGHAASRVSKHTGGPEACARVLVSAALLAPRSRRRMEPFSSKIEIGLRDQVDAYVSEHGESIVDLLDRALRDVITKQPPASSR
jgi:hypothetical protein